MLTRSTCLSCTHLQCLTSGSQRGGPTTSAATPLLTVPLGQSAGLLCTSTSHASSSCLVARRLVNMGCWQPAGAGLLNT